MTLDHAAADVLLTIGAFPLPDTIEPDDAVNDALQALRVDMHELVRRAKAERCSL